MTFALPYSLLLQLQVFDLVRTEGPVALVVLLLLLFFSVLSWAIIFSKWGVFRRAQAANGQFLRALRKSPDLATVALASEQFRQAPLVPVFDAGYREVDRQLRSRGGLRNQAAIERTLQLGASEELGKLESNMNWLATTAAVTPFIGLFGTVLGIIDAFQGLGTAGSVSLRAVAPGISAALIATALGLAAAIPAAIAYNYFNHAIREQSTRMEDFILEFMNLTERRLEE